MIKKFFSEVELTEELENFLNKCDELVLLFHLDLPRVCGQEVKYSSKLLDLIKDFQHFLFNFIVKFNGSLDDNDLVYLIAYEIFHEKKDLLLDTQDELKQFLAPFSVVKKYPDCLLLYLNKPFKSPDIEFLFKVRDIFYQFKLY